MARKATRSVARRCALVIAAAAFAAACSHCCYAQRSSVEVCLCTSIDPCGGMERKKDALPLRPHQSRPSKNPGNAEAESEHGKIERLAVREKDTRFNPASLGRPTRVARSCS